MTRSLPYSLEPRAGGAQHAPPEDGIVAHGHTPGRLGALWQRTLERIGGDARERVARGKNHARRGRVRALEVGPGAAAAEVITEASAHPTARVRTFGRQEWESIVQVLHDELDLLAALVEGELSERLLDRLQGRGVHLCPDIGELSFDCDCGDFVMPCAHVGALLHTLGDAIDGDPYQLFTLRGRTRDQVLAGLRAALGDDAPGPTPAPMDEAPPAGDWLSSPSAIPDFSCSIPATITPAAGLRAMGPIPGAPDLLHTLEPLYTAGAAAAVRVIEQGPALRTRRTPRPPGLTSSSPWERGDDPPPPRPTAEAAPPAEAPRRAIPDEAPRKASVAEAPRKAPAAAATPPAERHAPPAATPPATPSPTPNALRGALPTDAWTTTQALSEQLGMRISDVRRELVTLEKAGSAERDTRPDGVWWRAREG